MLYISEIDSKSVAS